MCRNKISVNIVSLGDFKLPVLLAGSIKYIDAGSSARVPGAVRVSSQDTVITGRIPATEGCRRLDNPRV